MKQSTFLFPLPIAFAFLVALSGVPLAAASDWPQFLGPERNGISSETGLTRMLPRGGPARLWRVEVGEGFSGPVVADGRLVLFHRVKDEEVIECFDAAKGTRLWKAAYPTGYEDNFGKGNGPRSTPVISGKRLVTLGAEGALTCLDFESGRVVWAKKLVNEYRVPPSYFGVATSPLVDDGLVLVNVGAKNAGIVAFSMEDGKEVWKATSDAASYSSPIVCTINGTRHAVFFTREGPVVLDPRTGAVRYRQRWRARYDASVNAATPLVIGDQLFLSASYETGALLLKVRRDGADEIWSDDKLMSNHYNTCIYRDGYLYGFDGRQEAGPDFRCVDLKERRITWNKPRFGCGSMIFADGMLIVLTERGELILVEATPKEYRELGRAQVLDAGPCRAQIALASGKLYVRDQRNLLCLDLRR